jgi:hypothetical protein
LTRLDPPVSTYAYASRPFPFPFPFKKTFFFKESFF